MTTAETESMPRPRRLLALLAIYAGASLLHFIHNAEYLADYPGLPPSWTRFGVYAAWLGLTAVGLVGVLLLWRRWLLTGLAVVAVYASLGLDSLGHYVVAPLAAHATGMNLSILAEVGAAAAVLLETLRQLVGHCRWRRGRARRLLPTGN